MRTEFRNYHHEPLLISEYEINDSINNIVDKIIKYNLKAYRDLPIDTDLILLDAAIKSLTLVYNDSANNKEYVTIDFNMKIPTTARKRLNEIVSDINALKEKSKLIREKKEKR